MDSASLLVYFEKKISIWVWGSLLVVSYWGHVFAILWLRLLGPGRQPNGPFLCLNALFESRLSFEFLEPLIGFLASLEQKLWLNTKNLDTFYSHKR